MRESFVSILLYALGFLIVCFCFYGIVHGQSQETLRKPWVGPQGVARTTSEIMESERIAAASRIPGLIRRSVEHEVDRTGLKQNPNSPDVRSWPPRLESQPPSPLLPFSPQILGTSFTGATLADVGAFPPDCMGAVGPTQFIVAINGRIRSFNKATGTADGVMNFDMDV